MTELNKKHAYCGSTDISLCDDGIYDLQDKKKLHAYPDISECKIIYSGLKRTYETINCLYPELIANLCSDSRIREMDFGDFEGFSYEELKDNALYQKWISGNNEVNFCPNGESGLQMKERVLSFFKDIEDDDKSYAVFTHGGPIASIMEYLFPKEGKNRWQWQSDFGEGYEIIFSANGISYGKIPY